jgi:Flp pilus assembly protein TadD
LRDSGICLSRLNRRDEAIAQFRKALQIKPDFVDAVHHLALTLHELKRLEEALATFDRALSLSPDNAEIINNRGNVLMSLGRNEEALAHYGRAIALKPDFTEAHANRGLVLDELYRMDEAAESYRKSIALKSDYPNAHWNLAINRLRVGDLKTGWVEAEWRWKTPKLPLIERNFKCPLWLGAEPLRGKTILLHNDQGLGDALHFCRYVPMVAAMGANVILEVQKELYELLSGLAGVSKLVSRGETLPDFDFHCSLGSLPLAFDTVLDTVPSATPYISVGNYADAWKNRLASVKSPRIGLVWSGNPTHTNDRNRSMALEVLLALLDADAGFVSLQKDARLADREILDQRKEILDLGPELKSFADTAAVVSHLDLVISVDTSVVHLAGALGRPVWVLLPYVPDWRWLIHRTDSPWYPTARLFRQTEARDWRTVVHEVRTELDSLVASLANGAVETLAGDHLRLPRQRDHG